MADAGSPSLAVRHGGSSTPPLGQDVMTANAVVSPAVAMGCEGAKIPRPCARGTS